jgi:SlyX protein
MSEERLIELEIKVAYQDDLLHTLNNIVSEQQQQIQRLEKICQLLYERINSLSTESNRNNTPIDEVPPHY